MDKEIKRYEDFRYPGFRNQNNSVFRKGIHFLGIALFEEIAVALAPFSVTLRKCVVALLPHTVHMPEGMCKVNPCKAYPHADRSATRRRLLVCWG